MFVDDLVGVSYLLSRFERYKAKKLVYQRHLGAQNTTQQRRLDRINIRGLLPSASVTGSFIDRARCSMAYLALLQHIEAFSKAKMRDDISCHERPPLEDISTLCRT